MEVFCFFAFGIFFSQKKVYGIDITIETINSKRVVVPI